MFEYLAGFRAILVTGPQRSGTCITARCIAQDLGYKYVDEDDIGWRDASQNKENRLLAITQEGQGIVVQAPACAHICTVIGTQDDVAVVFVMRQVEDILASQERIGWPYEDVELNKYPEEYRLGTAAETKYAYWEGVQKPLIRHPFEVEYESLRGHPLWIEDRRGFGPRQWSHDRR